ncbi:ABC transporter permease [Caproiciproducens sp.]
MKTNSFMKAVKRIPGMIWGVLIVVILFTILNPRFVAPGNLENILTNSSVLMIVSIGMTMSILSEQIDMSVGGITTLSSMVACMYMQGIENPSAIQILICILIGVAVGTAVGIFNGVMIGILKYNFWLITFATMSMTFGLSQVVTGGDVISGFSKSFRNLSNSKIAGIPSVVLFAAATIIIMIFILHKTRFGMHVYAVGDSEQCADQSGIDVSSVRVAVYTISGAMAGFAGVLLAARTNSASPIIGSGYEFDAMAAVIVGGTSFDGGKGGLGGTVIGVLAITAIKNGLLVIGLSNYVQQVLIGVFILSIIIVNVVSEAKKKKQGMRRIYR